MEQRYDSKSAEEEVLRFWEEGGIFKFDENSKLPLYSIDTPPPTISGDIHLGHVFSYSQAEFIARYRRMRGFNVFYPFGLDNNGLPTELLIEKKFSVTPHELGRDKFVELVSKEIEAYNKEYVALFKRLGVSADWSLTYQTISKEVQRISQKSFVELYKKGRIYKKEGPVLYCPKCRTTVSQMELTDKILKSKMVYIKFDKDITIATTRPELLPACVAIFVNPEDKKNAWLIGKEVKVPIFGQSVKVIGDKRVDPEKGTGVVMCCTFGDQTDIEWYLAYNLPLHIIIGEDGKMSHEYFKGMKIAEARAKIIDDLKARGLVVREEEIEHAVNTHERCGTEIEYIVKNQWYIKYLDLKEKLIELGNEVRWYPDFMKVRYINWVNGLQWDWNISRQRYFGVYFPVWYCKRCGKPKIAREEDLPVNPFVDKPREACECGSTEFVPETDVLDTWATSSLTPLINAHWGTDEKYMNVFPMSLRPQAHDIITFWAFTTIVKSYLHMNSIPWRDIMISGHGLDPHGKPMHKSTGNVIYPKPYIERYGADAVRYWASSASLGEDCSFQEKEVVAGSRLINKLWNVARFIEMNSGKGNSNIESSNIIDKWILYELYRVVSTATEDFENYNYYHARNTTENFFWKFANDYLEFIKYRIYKEDRSASRTLEAVFLNVLKLFAPFMPFVTEKIYLELFIGKGIAKDLGEDARSIHISRWPIVKEISERDYDKGVAAVNVITAIRRWKHDNKIALNGHVKEVVIQEKFRDLIEPAIEDIKGSMNVGEVKFSNEELEIEAEGGIRIKIEK